MKIGFYLAHPAHFHLFKHTITSLKDRHEVFVAYNQKDVLHNLVQSSEFASIAHEVRATVGTGSKFGLLWQFIQKVVGAFFLFARKRPDLVMGTPILISLIGKILGYKSVIVNEDDFDVVKKTADFGYPHASHILAPSVCRTTQFDDKTITYPGYHELAYLHPNHFTADRTIVDKYFPSSDTYFILRFAKLTAHHDDGKTGITTDIALRLIELLSEKGTVYITSERELESELEPFRIRIDPKDMHHVMAFCSLYIGDSQTMAAEAGVLGVPFIRFNDFVGKISYLDELENTFDLGFGIETDRVNELYETVRTLLALPNLHELFNERKQVMLREKIDLSKFLIHFVDQFPNSTQPNWDDKAFKEQFQ